MVFIITKVYKSKLFAKLFVKHAKREKLITAAKLFPLHFFHMNEFENPGITLEYISEDQNSLGLFFMCKKHKHLRPTFLAVFVKLSDTRTLCT